MTLKSTSSADIKAARPIGSSSDPVSFWRLYSDLLAVTDR